jgi:hypothetical protein
MAQRLPLLRPLAGAFAFSLIAVLVSGCPGQTTVNQFTQHLDVNPILAGGTFTGYTGTTFGETIPSNKKVTLLSAAMTSSTGEFSFISSMTGTATQSGGEMLMSKASFSGAANPTDLDVVDTGDLLPLYPDQDFRVYWTVQLSPTLAQAYPNGATLTFTYSIEID